MPTNQNNQITLDIQGMHCASCVKLIERALKKIPGVIDVSANLATNQAYLKTEKNLDMDLAKKEVEAVGYGIKEKNTQDEDPSLVEMKKARQRMWIAWAFALPIAL